MGSRSKVIQLLDSMEFKYRLLPHAKPAYTCEAAAAERNVPLDEMIKCILLVDRKKNYYLVCMTADEMVDTAKVRAFMDSSRLSFASEGEIEEISGYEMGALPPLLLKKDIPVIFDDGIMGKEKVNISSGDPRMGLEINSEALISIIKPKFGDVTK